MSNEAQQFDSTDTSPIESEEAVHDYLTSHPDFFERHADLLRSLRLPHVTGGTVSLIERQVSALRQRDDKLEQRLTELVQVARTNDALAAKIHRLALGLLTSDSQESALERCETALRTEFDAEQPVLVLFSDTDADDGSRFVRRLARGSETLQIFDNLLKRSSPRCGQIRDSQRDFLFGAETNEIGSCALVPLGENCEVGFLAIGSADADRFHPAMSIDFLARIGELIAAALSRY